MFVQRGVDNVFMLSGGMMLLVAVLSATRCNYLFDLHRYEGYV